VNHRAAGPASFLEAARRNPVNAALLDRLPALGLPDAWLVAGCLVQTLWNVRSNRPPGEGIRDYDIFYCDTDDLSWEAEDRHISRVATALADLEVRVELRNQARVHLWYGARFGPGYPALRCSRQAIDLFLIDCTRVALQAGADGAQTVYAPCDWGELFGGVLRPNRLNHRPGLFAAKAESYRARWPWLRVEGSVANSSNAAAGRAAPSQAVSDQPPAA
jgi:hypothetical protein